VLADASVSVSRATAASLADAEACERRTPGLPHDRSLLLVLVAGCWFLLLAPSPQPKPYFFRYVFVSAETMSSRLPITRFRR